ncbi:transposon Ty3-G Gag-Pol polyprotein [Trichonephila clavipes]|nr:transposon Ty3-G Gag-Pol polyprotein [Trichonephila clavipes]
MSSPRNSKLGTVCSIFECSMRSDTNLLSTVKMYRFPASPSRRLQWEAALQRKSWKVNPKSVLCNKHFITGGAETFFRGRIRFSKTPSELLRNMKRRAESLKVDDKLIMELFLQRLPSSVQTILAAVPDLTLKKAADIAERILEVSPSPIETFAVSNKKEQTSETELFRGKK